MTKKKRIVCFMLILAMISATVLSTTAFAASSYSGSTYEFNYTSSKLNFTMKPYLYYSSNTSTSITVDHMEMYLVNKGSAALLTFQFNAWNGTGYGNNGSSGGDLHYDEENIELYKGESGYVKTGDWSKVTGKSATYTKNTSGAIFSMGAGQYALGTVDIWANTDKTFSCVTQGTATSSLGANIRSADELSYIETREPKLIDSNGSEYDLTLESLENGEASYSVNISKDDISDATLVSPVIYMEKAIDTIEIPVNADISDAALDTVEIKAGGQESESYVVVKFTANDSDFVPYDMVLVSDGVEYESTISMYCFDNESGDFTRGCYIFRDLLVEDLGANVYLKADSALEKSVPEIVVY